LDNFEARLQEELRITFDRLSVHTPPPHRARYSRSSSALPVHGGPRTLALGMALLSLGVLLGLAGTSGSLNPVSWGRQVAVIAGHCRQDVVASDPASCLVTPMAASPASKSRGRTTSAGHQQPSPPLASVASSSSRVVRAASPAGRPSAPPSDAPRGSTSPSPTPAPVVLFSDGFESDALGVNPPSGWHVDDGQWEVMAANGGQFVRHSSNGSAGHLVAGPAVRDASMSAEVRPTALASGSAGVAGRYQGPGDYYECGVYAGTSLQLWRVQGGSPQYLGGASDIKIDPTTFHTVRLDLRGSQLTCSIDGNPAVRATDAALSSGRFALVASQDEPAEFDGVRVTS
jgi:hypothetical protein